MEDFLKSQELSRKLRLIASIGDKQKLDTISLELYNNNSATKFWRTLWTMTGYKGHSREDLLRFIDVTANESYQLILKYNNTDNDVNYGIIRQLIIDLHDARCNILRHIKDTYSNDSSYISKLESLDYTIELRLNNINNPHSKSSMINKTQPMSILSNNISESSNICYPNDHSLGNTPPIIHSVLDDSILNDSILNDNTKMNTRNYRSLKFST